MSRIIRVFPELGSSSPLWEPGSHNSNPSPEDLGLSEDLAERLREWYQFWLDHSHWDTGFDSEKSKSQFLAMRRTIINQLRGELADSAVVVDG